MIVVHEAQPFTPEAPPPVRRRASLIWVVLLFFALAIGVAGAGIYLALREPVREAPKTGLRNRIASVDFSRLPDRNVEAIVDETIVSDQSRLKHMSAQEAEAYNARIPVDRTLNAPARPMNIPLGDGVNFLRSLDCMTAAIYYEAAGEPADGQRAVAQVVLNRVRHVAYPHSVCGVVFQGSERETGCQFSFTCDGSMARIPSRGGWLRARQVAGAALGGLVYAPVGLATHYHADYVVPYWASSLLKVSTIGRHIFYRWPGLWGKSDAFTSRYQGNEQPFPTGAGTQTADADSDGVAGLIGGGMLADGTALPAGRPVLKDGAGTGVPVPTGTAALPAGAMERADAGLRAWLSSRAAPPGKAAQPALPPPPPQRGMAGGVTGGVIMAGARPPAAAAPSVPQPSAGQ
jgi:spore germination cell wall hydrolase CwlJ-like protein